MLLACEPRQVSARVADAPGPAVAGPHVYAAPGSNNIELPEVNEGDPLNAQAILELLVARFMMVIWLYVPLATQEVAVVATAQAAEANVPPFGVVTTVPMLLVPVGIAAVIAV